MGIYHDRRTEVLDIHKGVLTMKGEGEMTQTVIRYKTRDEMDEFERHIFDVHGTPAPVYGPSYDDLAAALATKKKELAEYREALREAESAIHDACHATAIYGDQPPQMYLDALKTIAALDTGTQEQKEKP